MKAFVIILIIALVVVIAYLAIINGIAHTVPPGQRP